MLPQCIFLFSSILFVHFLGIHSSHSQSNHEIKKVENDIKSFSNQNHEILRKRVKIETNKEIEFKSKVISSQPIIAIVTQPVEEGMQRPNTSIVHTEYVSWVEQSGARALAFPHEASDELLDTLLPQVSGIIFQGGETELIDRFESKYLQTSLKILNYAWDHNIPVFGICLGFELLMVWASGNPKIILDLFNAENVTMPLIFESDFKNSNIFANLNDNLVDIFSNQPVTINLHHNGITRETFLKSKLDRIFRIVSYNYDLDGKNFISIVEAHNKPFYGVQFHPERNAYIENPIYATNRSPDALLSQRYFSDFFIREARKKNDGGSTPCCSTPIEKYLIHRFASSWVDFPDYLKRVYFFEKKDFD